MRLAKTNVPRRWALWGLSVLLALVASAPMVWVRFSTSDSRFVPSEVPERPVAIVLGAGLRADGTPTTLLARRLDIAVGLYHSERVHALLVSGDNSHDAYNETDAMRAYLVAAGVPEAKVVGDHAGFSTWESCTRAREIFGVEAATVVTQAFHLPRAVALCRAAGIDTVGAADASWEARPTATAYGHLREFPAAVKAALDAWLRPDPTFLGPRETGVDEALAAPRD